MNILYIWDADYPWDVRVEKICKTLHDEGHKVHILSRNLKKKPVYEYMSGLNIHRLRSFENDHINYFLSFPLFFNPIWRRCIDNIINSSGIELIIVRDLPMAVAGIWAGKRHKIPVIFDMAEDYVAMIRDIWRAKKLKGLNFIIRNPYFAKLVEIYSLKNSDHVLVVIDEALELLSKKNVNSEKITIVGNTPKLSSFSHSEMQMNDDLILIEKKFSVIYTGGIQSGRGIQTVIEAIPEIIKKIPDFLFVVIGNGYATNQLKRIIHDKQLDNYVKWIGWVEHNKIYDYIRCTKIGLIPHLVTDHVNTTIPNKLFDYMGCGIPVIASDSIPMKRIIEEEKCGICFKSGEVEDFVIALLKIYNSPFDYGRNGLEAIRLKYNWEEDEKRLHRVVKMF